MNEWKNLKLLEGWKAVKGFRPPQFKIGRGFIDLRGYGEGDVGKPIAFIGKQYSTSHPISTRNHLGQMVEYSIDVDGYLWVKDS